MKNISLCPTHGSTLDADGVCASCKYSTPPRAAEKDARIFSAEEEARIRQAVLTEDQRARRSQYQARDAERDARAAVTRRRNGVVNRRLAVFAAATFALVGYVIHADTQKRQLEQAFAVKPSTNYTAQCITSLAWAPAETAAYRAWLGYDPCERRAIRMNAAIEAEKLRASGPTAVLTLTEGPR